MALPERQGLYDPRNEHDSCGIGFVANIRGRKSHDIIARGLQILVNLIRNAMQAFGDAVRNDKQVTLRITKESDRMKIAIIDNGIGIPKENMDRIFGHGFTTRKEGHGFGLHSSALAAKELGGALAVFSEGSGRGAKFTLELPIAEKPTVSVSNIRD